MGLLIPQHMKPQIEYSEFKSLFSSVLGYWIFRQNFKVEQLDLQIFSL